MPRMPRRFEAECGTAGFGPRPPRGVGQSSVEPRESKTGEGPGVCPTLRGSRPGSGRKGGEGKQVTKKAWRVRPGTEIGSSPDARVAASVKLQLGDISGHIVITLALAEIFPIRK